MAKHLAVQLDHRTLASGLDHVEGVCWDPSRRCLWGGGEAGQIYRIELDGTSTVVATIDGGSLLGVALDGMGRLYVCDPGNHRVWRLLVDATVEPFGDAIDYPNYLVFSAYGQLFVSDSGSFDEPTGRLITIDANGVTRRLGTRPIGYANGLCCNATTLWIVESSVPGVSAYDLASGNLEMVIEMDRCTPDGLALDAAGGLLISCFQPNQLWRWTTTNGLELLFDDWTGEYLLSPTNVAFYGETLERLALASLCGRTVNSLAPPYAGFGLYYPDFEKDTP